jgi:O-antigen ligase
LLQAVFLHLLAARSGLIALYILLGLGLGYLLYVPSLRRLAFPALLVSAAFAVVMVSTIPTLRLRWNYVAYTVSQFSDHGLSANYSDMSRVISYDIAWRSIVQSPLAGVGSGDMMLAMTAGYEHYYPSVAPAQRLVPHNQLLIAGLACGFPGILLFSVWWICPVLGLRRSFQGFMLLAAWLMMLVPMMAEPMLEVQFGVFVSLFFTILFYHHYLTRPVGHSPARS